MATSTLGNGTLVLAGTTSGTTTVTATAVAGTTTLTLPAATDTLVGKATTDTLTNKTLTSPAISGVATFSAGTAALPAITTTGDTNTGIWFPAADTIAFTEGGVESMRIDASGNLGVGATTMSGKIHSVGTTPLFMNNAAFTAEAKFDFADSGATLQLHNFYGTGSNITFYTNPNGGSVTERARIDSSGNLLVGTTSSATGNTSTFQSRSATSSDFGLAVTHTSTDDNVRALLVRSPNSSSDDGYLIIGARSTGDRFFVRTSGNVQNTNNSYGAISDVKLKENIVDATPKLEKLNQVRIVNYNLIGESHKQIGVIAQELEAVFPAMVEESLDYEEQIKTREVEVPAVAEVRDDEGNVTTEAVEATTRTEEYTERIALGTKTKSVKYSVFVPILIKAMQEQQALIAQLQADVAALKGA